MSEFKEKLQQAIENKKNDLNTYIWKFPKVKVGDKFVQDELKLIDASEEQLNTFYTHCQTMLYNNNPKDPANIGRYHLLKLISEQRTKCNAMLLINWLAAGSEAEGRMPYPRNLLREDMRVFLDTNKEKLPPQLWKTTPITAIMDVPVEFSRLSIDVVLEATLDYLGVFDKRHITNNFIIKMGLWFTNDEIKDLNEKDEITGKNKNRLDVVRQRCDLRPDTRLFINQKGLTYKEFRAMRNLKSKRYSELTTDQLTILRDKILFKLEEEVKMHIQQWEERSEQIRRVAEFKGITLNNVD